MAITARQDEEMPILLPAIAAKTYNKLKSELAFRKITKRVLTKMTRISDPIKKARWFHSQIDSYMEDVVCDDIAKKHIQCKQGCSACCHTQVSVTEDEAVLLAKLVVSGQKIDVAKLHQQAQAANDAGKWYQIPYQMRGCVFLDGNNNCTVYEDRPAVCRTNYVVSDAEQCKTMDGVEQPVQLLNTFEADMAIVAGFQSSKENGALPYMLWKALQSYKIGLQKKKVFNGEKLL